MSEAAGTELGLIAVAVNFCCISRLSAEPSKLY